MLRQIVAQEGILIIIDLKLAIFLEMTGSTMAAFGRIVIKNTKHQMAVYTENINSTWWELKYIWWYRMWLL